MKIFKLINKNLQTSVNFDFMHKPEEPKILPVITISREKGSGVSVLATKLVKKLGKRWDYYHKNIVEKIAEESNVPSEKVTEIEEKSVSYLQDVFESWIGKDYFSLNSYHRTLLKVLCDIGNQGYAVIVGRGANFIFKDALKIRVISDEETRIARIMEHWNLSRKEAEKTAIKVDAESKKFISTLYNKDITDPHNFDLVIKTGSQMSVEEAVDIIVMVAKKKFKF